MCKRKLLIAIREESANLHCWPIYSIRPVHAVWGDHFCFFSELACAAPRLSRLSRGRQGSLGKSSPKPHSSPVWYQMERQWVSIPSKEMTQPGEDIPSPEAGEAPHFLQNGPIYIFWPWFADKGNERKLRRQQFSCVPWVHSQRLSKGNTVTIKGEMFALWY